jgi:hypothetical protein
MEAKRRKDKEQEMQELMAKRARLEKEEIPDYRVRMRNERQRYNIRTGNRNT